MKKKQDCYCACFNFIKTLSIVTIIVFIAIGCSGSGSGSGSGKDSGSGSGKDSGSSSGKDSASPQEYGVDYDYNHVVVYGQSLATGYEGWPALSKAARYGNLMLGGCVRPVNTHGANFTPFGGASLQPLISNVQSGNFILSDSEVSALPPKSGALGETVNQGMVNLAKKMHDLYYLRSDGVFVTTNNGVSGRTIEQLSKDNTQDATDRYSRFTDAASQIKTIADDEAKSYGVTALVWMQGESNYWDGGGSWNKAAYKTLLSQLRDDMVADCRDITGQTEDPVFITYQTGAAYTRDVDSEGTPGLHVGMAQWEVSKEHPGVFMAGPVYPYTDKGGHLDSNGTRWFGNQLGKVYNKIVTEGQNWKPLSPTSVSLDEKEVLINFHVPEPPLVFDTVYVGNTAKDYTDKGFYVTDSTGIVAITNVDIVGDTIVKLTLAREPDNDAHVWYANQDVHGGNGNLRDSDETIADDNYEYLPDEGMYESANITELVGKPYPLHNWCIAFYLPLN